MYLGDSMLQDVWTRTGCIKLHPRRHTNAVLRVCVGSWEGAGTTFLPSFTPPPLVPHRPPQTLLHHPETSSFVLRGLLKTPALSPRWRALKSLAEVGSMPSPPSLPSPATGPHPAPPHGIRMTPAPLPPAASGVAAPGALGLGAGGGGAAGGAGAGAGSRSMGSPPLSPASPSKGEGRVHVQYWARASIIEVPLEHWPICSSARVWRGFVFFQDVCRPLLSLSCALAQLYTHARTH
jgi:hypothetical protein